MTQQAEPIVAINAQLVPGTAGGVESNLMGLVRALASDESSGSQVVVTRPGGFTELIETVAGNRQRVLEWPPIAVDRLPRPAWLPAGLSSSIRRSLAETSLLGPLLVAGLRGARLKASKLMRSLALQRVTAVHFPYQSWFETGFPTIYEPWDLLHVHHPELLPRGEVAVRDELYRRACRDAALIVTATAWAKKDLVQQLGLDPSRIAVIRRGSLPMPTSDRSSLHLDLPLRYVVYPAVTWPHKNHLGLLNAISIVRKEVPDIELVCVGAKDRRWWPDIARCAEDLGLRECVRFFEHLPRELFVNVLRGARFVVFPSFFEGFGLPLVEAMQAAVPIVCSDATCLPEVAGDAALYFDPRDVDAMATVIGEAWCSEETLQGLRAAGATRLTMFDWTRGAQDFVACYRFVSGSATATDNEVIRRLLSTSWPS